MPEQRMYTARDPQRTFHGSRMNFRERLPVVPVCWWVFSLCSKGYIGKKKLVTIRITTCEKSLRCARHRGNWFPGSQKVHHDNGLGMFLLLLPALDTQHVETETLNSLSKLTQPGSSRDGISIRQFWLWGPRSC